MDCSLPGSSVHGISQGRILEWVAISSSRGSSQPWDWTHTCLASVLFKGRRRDRCCSSLASSTSCMVTHLRMDESKCHFLIKSSWNTCPSLHHQMTGPPSQGSVTWGVCVHHCICEQHTTVLCNYSSMSMAPPADNELEDKRTGINTQFVSVWGLPRWLRW